MTKVTYNYMTTNAAFTLDALSTESVVEDFTVNKQTFTAACMAAIASAQILDQFKRSVFYKKDFDREKVKHYANELRVMAETLDQTTEYMIVGDREALNVDTRVAHGVIGTFTEAGELLEALVEQIQTGSMDSVNLKEEIGDVQWYQHVLANAAGTNIDQCLEAVVKKLKDKKKGRYADGYSHESAVERDIDAEREVLEQALERN